jgi:hypothetical protein
LDLTGFARRNKRVATSPKSTLNLGVHTPRGQVSLLAGGYQPEIGLGWSTDPTGSICWQNEFFLAESISQGTNLVGEKLSVLFSCRIFPAAPNRRQRNAPVNDSATGPVARHQDRTSVRAEKQARNWSTLMVNLDKPGRAGNAAWRSRLRARGEPGP